MKEIFIRYWNMKRFMGLYSSEYITNMNNYEISESNNKCKDCTRNCEMI